MLIDMREILFWRKIFYHSNVVLHMLAAECSQFIAANPLLIVTTSPSTILFIVTILC